MRNLLLSTWLFSALSSFAEGCSGVYIKLNNSQIIYPYSAPSILMSGEDSLSFYAYGMGGTTVASLKLYWNDSLIYQTSGPGSSSPPAFNFAQREGAYKAVFQARCLWSTEISYFYLTKTITGVHETERSEDLTVLPNPASEKIIVYFTDETIASYEIMNVGGKIIQSASFETPNIEILVETLANGIYLLRIQTNNRRVITKKIVVAH